uniref:Magnetosome protein Mad11 n=1 Tax=delta proteobacterium ML-1 TaxID=947513 RepID=U5IGJ8_9DELT|nr:magnetosome protein Mad11 [delta proteobacterium ML-1]
MSATMPECKEVISDVGRVSQALVVYTGLKSGSLVVRCGDAVLDASRRTTQVLGDIGAYSLAAARYAGLLSQSTVVRGGRFTARCVSRITTPVVDAAAPVTRAVGRPFSALASVASRITTRTDKALETVTALETRVVRLEERLAELERFGVRPKFVAATAETERKKDPGSDRRAFLRAVLEENKVLRTS